MRRLLGVDIGGTKMESAIIEIDTTEGSSLPPYLSKENWRCTARLRCLTNRERGYKPVLADLLDLFNRVLAEAGCSWAELDAIGLGMPGAVDPKRKVVLNGNSTIFIGKDICQDIREAVSFVGSIHIANDANCFALAEHLAGAGRAFAQNTSPAIGVGLILGTGMGAGAIYHNRLLSGATGGGMEAGHSVLYADGRDCYCGQQGCAEQYLCGQGVSENYFVLTGERIPAQLVFERIAEKAACRAIARYRQDLALLLANLSQIIQPHYFVLGGGVSAQPAIYEGLEDLLYPRLFLKDHQPRILANQLGDSSGVFGAAFLDIYS